MDKIEALIPDYNWAMDRHEVARALGPLVAEVGRQLAEKLDTETQLGDGRIRRAADLIREWTGADG